MDICVLPQEIVENIAHYMSLNDILSCCSVNSTWRKVLNDNKIWFDLCSKRSPVFFDRFSYITEPCSVSPRFEFLKGECEGLEKICVWRERFMQEAHLTRNWRHGRHSKHLLINYLEDDRDYFNFSNMQCEGNTAIVPYSEKRKFYVYDTCDKPILWQVVDYFLDYMIEDFFKLVDGRLVIVQCSLLQVFELTQNSVLPKHLFLFDRPQNESANLPEMNISSWYNSNIGLFPCDVSFSGDHNGRYFIGMDLAILPVSNPHFHVWDIVMGEKISITYIPTSKGLISSVAFSIYKSLLYVIVKYSNSVSNKNNCIYCFDFETLNFTNMNLEFNYVVPYILFSDSYILNVDRAYSNIYFWRRTDGVSVHKIPCDNRLNPLTLSVNNDSLIYAENNGLKAVVKAVSLSNLNSIVEFEVSFNVSNVCMVRDGLILVSVRLGILLFDLSTSSILTALAYEGCLWSNSSSSKIFMTDLDGLYLLCFW